MLILGIDDAGRGPIIGPMILAGVLISRDQEKVLKKYNVRDSKAVAHPMRVKLADIIKDNSFAQYVTVTYPIEIDSSLESGTNLNTLEAIKAAKIINEINTGKFRKETIKVVVDCPSTNIDVWTATLKKYVPYMNNLEIVCEHKADVNHVAVSAASILAKVTREEEVEKIQEKYKEFGKLGSGYPSDPFTKEFLHKHGAQLKDEGIFRKTWATWKEVFPDSHKGQKTLGEF